MIIEYNGEGAGGVIIFRKFGERTSLLAKWQAKATYYCAVKITVIKRRRRSGMVCTYTYCKYTQTAKHKPIQMHPKWWTIGKLKRRVLGTLKQKSSEELIHVTLFQLSLHRNKEAHHLSCLGHPKTELFGWTYNLSICWYPRLITESIRGDLEAFFLGNHSTIESTGADGDLKDFLLLLPTKQIS